MAKRTTPKLHNVGLHIEPNEKAFDVVCGMELDPTQARLHSEYKGSVYYFCSLVCQSHFADDPEKYVG